MKRNRKYSIFLVLLLCSVWVFGQQPLNEEKLKREAREHIREGNKLYNQLKFDEAEILYKKALTKTPDYPNAQYNLGNTIYQLDRSKEAAEMFEFVRKTFDSKEDRAQAFHNMGNAFMKEKQYQPAIEAFKNSLRNNSKDEETRYNLALAKELLEEQQQDNKGGGDNKDQKDQNKNEDGDGKENEDQKDNQDKENKNDKNEDDKKQGDNKNEDQKENEDQKDQDKKEQKPQRQPKLSPEQMKQLLEAMNNEENKTQKKMNAQKAKGKKVKQEKDW